MEFLGVGYQEILVIFAVMLVVVGPDRLPTMAYQIGRAVRTLQQYARAVRDEFKDEFEYIDDQMKVVKGGMADMQSTFREGDRELRRDLDAIAPGSIDLGLGPSPPSNVLPFGLPPVVSNGTRDVTTESEAGDSDSVPAGAVADPETPKAPLVF